MAKRTLPPSAFALPGLAKDTKRPFGVSSTREDFGFNSANRVSRTNARSSKLENVNDTSSLVDERGSLLPPHTEHTLENLTKTRPRSPGRRTPSPLARRKFEHDSSLSLEADNPQTSIRDHEDASPERINSLKERLNASPALILSNDVGFSVSSSELSLSRSSPRISSKNQANRPEVPPKPVRTRNRETGKSSSSATQMLNEAKILSVNEDDHKTIDHAPPPLPTTPPPLEDDEILGSLANDTLNEELKHSFKASRFEKTPKAGDKTSFDLSTKVGNPIKNPSEVNGLNRPRQSRDTTNSDTTDGNYSSPSRIAKWQGYRRASSEDNYASGMPKIGAGISKVESGIPDRQTSLDSAITSRLSKYESPYNSRQRKPVEKSMSANRRRFKPVTLTDESEETASESTNNNVDSAPNVAGTNGNQLAYERLHGAQTGQNYPDSLRRDHSKGMDVKSQPLSSPRSTREFGFQSNSSMSGEKVKPVSGHSSRSSVTDNVINVDKSRQKPGSLDLHGINRTTRSEPLVVQYDSNGYAEKDSASPVSVESSSKITFVRSDIRASNRSELNTVKSEFQSNVAVNQIKGSASDKDNDRNSRLANQQGSPGLTLPKVVIEYDGLVVKDSLVDGYDTEETSDEGKKMISSSIAEVQDAYTAHEVEDMSDGSLILDDDDDDIGRYGFYSDEEDVEDITLEDEDLTFNEPAREDVEERAKGIEELEQDEDGLTDQPLQIITEVSESEESDEVLFEPPPMFASSDEGEGKDELAEYFAMENGYNGELPSPVIPSSLLERQPQDDKRFHNLALDVWTEDDCIDWLDDIGLGHFRTEFREHHVDGKVLKNINFQLLEEIGINSPDEREVILSEIYRRFHPEEEDLFEMEIQGALQDASEQEKMKIMAVLNALRSPAFQAELGLTSSTGSSSPRDSDAGFHMASETASLSSSMTGSEGHSHDLGMPPPPPPPTMSAYSSHSLGRSLDDYEPKGKGGKSKKHGKGSKEKDKIEEKASKAEKQANKQKKHKRVSKLLDSLSLSSGSSKLTKLFHHHSHSSATSKKLNPAMQYLLQAGPQGLIRIWSTALSEEIDYCSFMVNMTTTSAEIIKLVFEKYEVVDDPRRFYISEIGLGKASTRHDLADADCPLIYQCRWTDPDKQRFELRCRDEGVIKMLFELEGYEDDLDYRSIPLSSKTPCTEALGIIVKKFHLPGDVSEYYLVEVSEENEDDREEVADHVCPLRLQMAWSAPDHVFRLCRRPTEVKEEEHKDALDGWATDVTEEISQEPGINSELSSVRDEDELEFAPDATGSIGGDEMVEEISEDFMEGLNELDHVIEEEAEAIASQELEAVREELAAKEEELIELRLRSDTLSEREDEIEILRRENEDLRRQAEEIGKLTVKDEVLVEKDRALEELRQENGGLRQKMDELEEKFDNEVSMRDREIERLYARNNELASSEKELENLRQLRGEFESQEKELEKLRFLNEESSSNQKKLALRLKEMQEKNNELLSEVDEMKKLKEINRELSQKVDKGELVRQQLDRSEAEKKELGEKLKELECDRKESERTGSDEDENLRKENLELTAKVNDAEEMKKNIIKLTTQLREIEKQNQEKVDNLQKKLQDSATEKERLLERIAELEEREKNEAQENSAKEVEDLKLENIFLVERTKEVDELKSAVAKLAAEARENESFKQKYKELRDVESYLTKQVNTAETIARQKDKKVKEYENKINTLTEAVKDMEAKLEEQEQNKLYLDQLIAMLKARDPSLLHVINTSLASSEQEEWC